MLWAWMSLEMLSGGNPWRESGSGDAVGEAADTVPDVEQHAAIVRPDDGGEQPAVGLQDATLVAVEAVRDDVAGDQVLEQPA